MVFRTRKAAIIGGILMIAMTWAVKAPMLVHWTSVGLVNTISLLLLFAAVVSILVGARMVQLGKRGRLPFVLHILFATLAFFASHTLRLLFAVPLALGVLVAATAIFWPVAIRAAEPIDKSGAEPV
jgi:hypothetical protein